VDCSTFLPDAAKLPEVSNLDHISYLPSLFLRLFSERIYEYSSSSYATAVLSECSLISWLSLQNCLTSYFSTSEEGFSLINETSLMNEIDEVKQNNEEPHPQQATKLQQLMKTVFCGYELGLISSLSILEFVSQLKKYSFKDSFSSFLSEMFEFYCYHDYFANYYPYFSKLLCLETVFSSSVANKSYSSSFSTKIRQYKWNIPFLRLLTNEDYYKMKQFVEIVLQFLMSNKKSTSEANNDTAGASKNVHLVTPAQFYHGSNQSPASSTDVNVVQRIHNRFHSLHHQLEEENDSFFHTPSSTVTAVAAGTAVFCTLLQEYVLYYFLHFLSYQYDEESHLCNLLASCPSTSTAFRSFLQHHISNLLTEFCLKSLLCGYRGEEGMEDCRFVCYLLANILRTSEMFGLNVREGENSTSKLAQLLFGV
jgi:hypothetical protein